LNFFLIEQVNKIKRVKWSENAIKALLSFLFIQKEKLKSIKYTRRVTSNPENVPL